MQEFYDAILPLTNRLYRFAYRLTQNERDAEDLVQDAMLRAYTKFDQFQSGTSPLAWMMVILRSIFINKYRKKKREGVSISFEDMASGPDRLMPLESNSLPDNPEDYLFRNVLDSELRDALQKLPQHYLEVILLVDLEDMSYREVSEVLGIPTGTVMSRLHRARRNLQGQLQDLAKRKGIVRSKGKSNVESITVHKKRGGTKYG